MSNTTDECSCGCGTTAAEPQAHQAEAACSCGCGATGPEPQGHEAVGACSCGCGASAPEPQDYQANTACSCGCGAVTSLTAAGEACACGCACCAGEEKPPAEEIVELTTLRGAIDRRLAELGRQDLLSSGT